MRPLLVSTFDLGASFGIADTAFEERYVRRAASLGDVGIESPLGWGSTLALEPGGSVMTQWRSEAQDQVRRLVEEEAIGWSADRDGPLDAFVSRLSEFVATHPVQRCTLTLYSVGVVYVDLRFGAGIPVGFCEGFLNCFEFAGYTPHISAALRTAAVNHREEAALAPHGPLAALTERPAPEITIDEKQYRESTQFGYFRHVVLCVDPGDHAAVERLFEGGNDEVTKIEFELHGCLHHSSGLFVFESKDLRDGGDAETMMRDAARILADIEVTHVFAGVCNAYSTIVVDAINKQVDAYSGAKSDRADPQRLNRLRAMSLAVVNLTRYELVTVTAEDQKYFAAFEAEEKLDDKKAQITGGVEVLYNVQDADQQERTRQRDNALNMVFLALTSLTLISVLADSYNFVGGTQPLLSALVVRAITLVLLLLLLGIVVFRLIRTVNKR